MADAGVPSTPVKRREEKVEGKPAEVIMSCIGKHLSIILTFYPIRSCLFTNFPLSIPAIPACEVSAVETSPQAYTDWIDSVEKVGQVRGGVCVCI